MNIQQTRCDYRIAHRTIGHTYIQHTHCDYRIAHRTIGRTYIQQTRCDYRIPHRTIGRTHKHLYTVIHLHRCSRMFVVVWTETEVPGVNPYVQHDDHIVTISYAKHGL